jgi:co-chaperonin GroES (HSP10)
MAKKIIPVKDFIVLELKKKDEFNLLLPGSDASAAGAGKYLVKLVGPECKSGIKIGDEVIPMNGQLQKLKIDGQEVAFTKEEWVSLIIREE